MNFSKMKRNKMLNQSNSKYRSLNNFSSTIFIAQKKEIFFFVLTVAKNGRLFRKHPVYSMKPRTFETL